MCTCPLPIECPMNASGIAENPETSTRRPGTRAHVVAIVPRGEVIRNFVYTGAFDRVQMEADLSVLSVLPNEDFRNLLASRYGNVTELRQYPEPYIAGLTRDVLDIAHNRWLWSAAAQERWRLRRTEARRLPDVLKLWGKRALCYPFANEKGLAVLSRIENTLTHGLRTTDEYVDLFRRTAPSVVFNGSHVHSRNAVQAVNAARHLRIPTATFVFSWDNLTSQGRMIPEYDYYFVWNEQIRRDLLGM